MDLEKSQKLIWELIGHCTQSKVHGPIPPRHWALLTGLVFEVCF